MQVAALLAADGRVLALLIIGGVIFLFGGIGLALGVTFTILRLLGHALTAGTVVLVALLLIAGLLFTLFAMLFDMESNRDLK